MVIPVGDRIRVHFSKLWIFCPSYLFVMVVVQLLTDLEYNDNMTIHTIYSGAEVPKDYRTRHVISAANSSHWLHHDNPCVLVLTDIYHHRRTAWLLDKSQTSFLSLSLSLSHTHTHTRARAHTRTHAHARTSLDPKPVSVSLPNTQPV